MLAKILAHWAPLLRCSVGGCRRRLGTRWCHCSPAAVICTVVRRTYACDGCGCGRPKLLRRVGNGLPTSHRKTEGRFTPRPFSYFNALFGKPHSLFGALAHGLCVSFRFP